MWLWQPHKPSAAAQEAVSDVATVRASVLRRRNTTHRRLLTPEHNDQYPLPAASNSRVIEEPFTTRVIRSRQQKSIGWMAALTAQPQVSVPPISAWLAPVAIRRRETERKLVEVDHTAIERYTPPAIAWFPPKVIRVDFTRKRIPQAPQDVYPPATGPPADYPAWAAQPQFKTSQDRRHLRAEDAPVYPETPKPEPNLCARIPSGFFKRRETTRRLLTVSLDQWTPTPASENNSRALEAAFVTRKIRSRKLKAAPFAPVFPATPAPPTVTYAAIVQARQPKRRGGRFRVCFVVTAYEARTQNYYPAFVARVLPKREGTERKLLLAPIVPVFPATPAAPVVYAALVRPAANRRHGWKELRKVGELNYYPTTAPVPPQPESAWRLPEANWIERARRLLPAAPQITYPQTPAPAVPLPAWIAKVVKHRQSTNRRLVHGEPQIRFQQAPVFTQPVTAWPLLKAHRRHGWRRQRFVLELDQYEETPRGTVARFTASREQQRYIALDDKGRYGTVREQGRFEAD